MNPLNRRRFISQISLSAAALTVLPLYSCSSKSPGTDGFVEAEITHGKIRGVRSGGVNTFRGIPYAGSVSGNWRFRRPADLEPWTGVRETIQLGAPSIQPKGNNFGFHDPDPAEDCLFLNLWTPSNDNKKRPVMFYNHGGGYDHLSAGGIESDGANLARNFDVVVVETNHRLGLLGFLYLDELAGNDYSGSGNNGLLDMIDGLKWVNRNINIFGGDPSNVMIFGESGGGFKTSCLYAMPAAAPYFNKAALQSGPAVYATPAEAANANTLLVLKALNIDPKEWRKILNIPAAELLAVQINLRAQTSKTPVRQNGKDLPLVSIFNPVVDGKILPTHPFDPSAPEISRNKPLLIGWNEDERTFSLWEREDTNILKIDISGLKALLEPQFGSDTDLIIETYRKTRPEASPVDLYFAITSISWMGLGSVNIAEKKVRQNGAPVYMYNFGYKTEVAARGTDYKLGTPHAMDIAFVFNNEPPVKDGTPFEGSISGNRPERVEVSHKMARMWTNFAKSGKPSAEGVPEWPVYSLNERPVMRIDEKCEVINDPFSEELMLWRSLGRL